MSNRVNVTKTVLPPFEELVSYIKKVYENGQLTNQGPLLLELEEQLQAYLKVRNLQFVANGTLAIQLALRGLGLEKSEIITTPFSYVATTSALLWEGCRPVFADIDPQTLCIDSRSVEEKITTNTKAILAVNVFGNMCEVEELELIADRHGLKVIYDSAHSFGVEYNGRSAYDYGDVSTASFHATKLFQTAEGGAVITRDNALSKKINIIKRFGHNLDDHIELGINAKASELHAAMGLATLPYVERTIAMRRSISEAYDQLLSGQFRRPRIHPAITKFNYAYYPIILDSETQLTEKLQALAKLDIFPRRYFYPSLNKLPYLEGPNQICPVSEDISSRILCLPLYEGLDAAAVDRIAKGVM